MCVIDFEWYWDGRPTRTAWQEGMTTCCRDSRRCGEPGFEYIEMLDCDMDESAFDVCERCEGEGYLIGGDEDFKCEPCEGMGYVPNREPHRHWVCAHCMAVTPWLDFICSGEIGLGSNAMPRQVEEHWDEGFGGPYSAPLAYASMRGWRGYSVAMIRDLSESAIRWDATKTLIDA